MVKDGHWRAVGEEGEKGAWEESVRLRERMFWTRIGGGVVPAFVQVKDSARSSLAEDRIRAEEKTLSRDGKHVVDQEGNFSQEADGLFHSNEKRISIGGVLISKDEGAPAIVDDMLSDNATEKVQNPAQQDQDFANSSLESENAAETRDDVRDSIRSSGSETVTPGSGLSSPKGEQRLSITIPGAFES